MICSNTIEEYNKKRPCWLPQDPSSPFSLCERCTFYKIEEILGNIRKGDMSNLSLFNTKEFQEKLCEQNHIDSLELALCTLKRMKNPSFLPIFTILHEKSKLNQTFLKNALRHSSSCLCPFYQTCFKQRRLSHNAMIQDLPWKCWTCLSWILRQNNTLGLYDAFARGLLSSNLLSYETVDETQIIDCMISLELKGKQHAARILYDRYRQKTKNDQNAKTLLESFYFQPAMIHTLFQTSSLDYIPSGWKEPDYRKILQKKALQSVRKRNWVFKEELIMRTWAPHRLFRWCFDLDELKDFAPEQLTYAQSL